MSRTYLANGIWPTCKGYRCVRVCGTLVAGQPNTGLKRQVASRLQDV